MKLSGRDIVIALMAIVIAALSWALIYIEREELRIHGEEFGEEIEIDTSASVEDGRAVVRVSAESQAASGIRVAPIRAAQSETSVQVYGSVVDVNPLLDLRGQFLAAAGETRAMRASVEAARVEYQRAQTLYQDDRNISEQAMRSVESRYRVAQARLVSAEAAESVLGDSLRSLWGPVVGAWAMQSDSAALQTLLKRQSRLVRLVFPHELPRSSALPRILIAPVSISGQQVEARFISESDQGSMVLPGKTYFYIVDGSDLRVGTRVVATVTTGGEKRDGTIVPNEAVVWHAGKAWVYVMQDPETFARYEISIANELYDGWFQSGLLAAGDKVVVSGAQLLLSEELKFQIRNENED
jgi:hypothetical protein